MNAQKSVSIIIPATDEVVSLRETVEQIKKLLLGCELQIILVTHPKLTTPECHTEIQRLQNQHPDIETFVQSKPGIGGAMQDAFERCAKKYTAIMSADLETDPSTLPSLLAAMDQGADVAATSRWKKGARFHGYNPVKFVLNFLFQQFFRILYWTSLTDLTFGYRIYRTEIIKKIRWEELRFPFFIEAILKPLRLGYSIVEVETPWVARKEGRSHNSFAETADYTRVGLFLRFTPKRKMLL